MDELREIRWLRRHALFALFGIFAVTILLVYLSGEAEWLSGVTLEKSASLVYFAAVLYAMVAVLVERVIRMWFWALDQREKWRAKWREEAEAAGRAAGLAAGRAEGRALGETDLLKQIWSAAQATGNAELAEQIERIAQEKSISLKEPPSC